ncbi:hypothetical protein Sste5346_005056 [Sporothrix stenoceras]|uniref:Uncharacterized protein n=1 Tax=Sporothrix stenoceras TaxID=5173 RepID=A0ABR3Z5V0_9PEZI
MDNADSDFNTPPPVSDDGRSQISGNSRSESNSNNYTHGGSRRNGCDFGNDYKYDGSCYIYDDDIDNFAPKMGYFEAYPTPDEIFQLALDLMPKEPLPKVVDNGPAPIVTEKSAPTETFTTSYQPKPKHTTSSSCVQRRPSLYNRDDEEVVIAEPTPESVAKSVDNSNWTGMTLTFTASSIGGGPPSGKKGIVARILGDAPKEDDESFVIKFFDHLLMA